MDKEPVDLIPVFTVIERVPTGKGWAGMDTTITAHGTYFDKTAATAWMTNYLKKNKRAKLEVLISYLSDDAMATMRLMVAHEIIHAKLNGLIK